MLMDTEEQCHRTCFALHLDGATLDAYTELKNIPGMKEGAEIKVVEGNMTLSPCHPYNTLTAPTCTPSPSPTHPHLPPLSTHPAANVSKYAPTPYSATYD